MQEKGLYGAIWFYVMYKICICLDIVRDTQTFSAPHRSSITYPPTIPMIPMIPIPTHSIRVIILPPPRYPLPSLLHISSQKTLLPSLSHNQYIPPRSSSVHPTSRVRLTIPPTEKKSQPQKTRNPQTTYTRNLSSCKLTRHPTPLCPIPSALRTPNEIKTELATHPSENPRAQPHIPCASRPIPSPNMIAWLGPGWKGGGARSVARGRCVPVTTTALFRNLVSGFEVMFRAPMSRFGLFSWGGRSSDAWPMGGLHNSE
jgi:hypothetical protein